VHFQPKTVPIIETVNDMAKVATDD